MLTICTITRARYYQNEKRGVMIELTDSCIVMLPEPKELPDSIYVVRYKLVFARQAFHYRD
jgi:hypothetical protein